MNIYLKELHRHNQEMANKLESYIKYTVMSDVTQQMEIYYDPMPYAKNGFMEKDNVHNLFYSQSSSRNACQTDINNLPWLIRLSLNREKMMNKEISLMDVKSKFCNNWEKSFNYMKGVKKEERLLLEKITQCAILSNNDQDTVPIIHIRLDITEFDFETLTNFLDTIVSKFKLKGLDDITDIKGIANDRLVTFDRNNGEVKNENQFVIYTEGINLLDIRMINGIDLTRTTCNNVADVYEAFGIEAARAVLLQEFVKVIEGAGNKVNYQHLSILVDLMTNNGSIVSVDRHGMNKLDTDPLARASFERMVDQFITAAVFGEKDRMESVSSRIMTGQVIKGGTGLCNVLLNTDLLENSEYVEAYDKPREKTFNELSTNPLMDDLFHKHKKGIFVPQ
jgi:DNA-directed RNA polymerase II subunit RPB1